MPRLFVGLAAAVSVYGRSVVPPQRGFDQNIGQYDRDVLFALDERVFSRAVVPDNTFAAFTADGSGRGAHAALNEDGTTNSADRPARAGSAVALFGTGASVAAGRIFIETASGAIPTAIEYLGPAAGLVPGVLQATSGCPRVSRRATGC